MFEYTDRWFGLSFNLKWPHDGFCLGIAYDFYDWEEDTPWTSILVRFLFLTIVFDYGVGEDAKEMYNNR
jgi:hypothetical protein|tara:strand:- start:156 stop:362 length:207 start_codon:yes stop_codon:yes gene_type:complete